MEPPWGLKAESVEKREAGPRGPTLGVFGPGFCAPPSSVVTGELLPLAQVFWSIIWRVLFLLAVASVVLPEVTRSLEAGQRGNENSPDWWPWMSP